MEQSKLTLEEQLRQCNDEDVLTIAADSALVESIGEEVMIASNNCFDRKTIGLRFLLRLANNKSPLLKIITRVGSNFHPSVAETIQS